MPLQNQEMWSILLFINKWSKMCGSVRCFCSKPAAWINFQQDPWSFHSDLNSSNGTFECRMIYKEAVIVFLYIEDLKTAAKVGLFNCKWPWIMTQKKKKNLCKSTWGGQTTNTKNTYMTPLTFKKWHFTFETWLPLLLHVCYSTVCTNLLLSEKTRQIVYSEIQ